MRLRRLSELPARSDVFLDANIMVYALSGVSDECSILLGRCARQEIKGICLLEVLNEVTHKLMLREAKSKSLIKSESAAELRRHFEAALTLADYWRDTERVLAQNLLFLPLSEQIVRQAHRERAAAGLLTNDSMIVACMRRYAITALATSDRDFERVAGITVYRPTDL